ncbi:MarR family winged helix-turn-helix transcriptional regulator [Ornithinibacillus bavariensis]|uniref:MarR family winged helix-turn-helix transcriptional regulator n=1 Tax=Ornithinibacillus bavariensis TaxID=545502 RepID=UPI000EB8BBA3|nr:hypothetical protein [Ornithinibacillus sp.]
MHKGGKPIGYWLREADKSISAMVNQKLEKYNVTRSHWQVLNTVYERDRISKEDLLNLLSHFIDDSMLNEIITHFIRQNWVIELNAPETLISMTKEGKEVFHDIFSTQQKTRMQLFEGVSEEEYEITINVLKRIIENAKR